MASYKYDGGQSDVPAKPKTPAKTESKAATPAKATAAQVSMNKAATAKAAADKAAARQRVNDRRGAKPTATPAKNPTKMWKNAKAQRRRDRGDTWGA